MRHIIIAIALVTLLSGCIDFSTDAKISINRIDTLDTHCEENRKGSCYVYNVTVKNVNNKTLDLSHTNWELVARDSIDNRRVAVRTDGPTELAAGATTTLSVYFGYSSPLDAHDLTLWQASEKGGRTGNSASVEPGHFE